MSPSKPLFSQAKPLIGVLQLLPLPGAPNWQGALADVVARAEQEAAALVTGGMDGLIIENTFDHPQNPDRFDAAGAVVMGLIAKRIQGFATTPIGINVLRNDPMTALAVATSVGADFIRVPLLTGAAIAESGIIQGQFRQLAEYRNQLQCHNIQIWADVSQSRVTPLLGSVRRTLYELALEAWEVGGAHGIIITDPHVALEDIATISQSLPVPVLAEFSGDLVDAAHWLAVSDGLITADPLKKGFATPPHTQPTIDLAKVESLRAMADELRQVGV